MTFDDFKGLIGLTFRNPQAAARALIDGNWPVSARWMALIVAVALSVILSWLVALMFTGVGDQAAGALMAGSPLAMAGIQIAAITLAAALMAAVGQMFGGHGRFEDALLLAVWIEFLLLIVQAAQVALLLLLPAAGAVMGGLAIALFLWLMVQFTKELHGFQSSLKVLLGLIGTAFAVGFVLSFIAAAFGLLPEIAP